MVRHGLSRLRKDSHVKSVLSEVRREFPLKGNESAKYEAEKRRNDRIDSRCNGSIRRAIRRELGETIAARYGERDSNCKGLRAAYLAMAVRRDCDKNATPGEEMLMAARYAGHFVDGETPSDSQLRHIVTTIGYSDYRCTGGVPYWTPEPTKRLGGLVYEADEAEIAALQQQWELKSTAETVRQILEYAKRGMSAAAEPPAAAETDEPTQQETDPMQSDNRIERLESQMQEMMAMMQKVASGQQTAAATEPETQAAPPDATQITPEIDPEEWTRPWDKLHKDELFGSGNHGKPARGKGASEERVIRAIDAMIVWNDRIGVDGDLSKKKWMLNNSAIREVAGVNGNVVKKVLESKIKGERETIGEKVDRHNQAHGLTSDFHNRDNHTGESARDDVFGLIANNRH
jgi:hypothetical protein